MTLIFFVAVMLQYNLFNNVKRGLLAIILAPQYIPVAGSVVTLKLVVKLEVLLVAVSCDTAASVTVYPWEGRSPLKTSVVVSASTVYVSVKGVWLFITRTA